MFVHQFTVLQNISIYELNISYLAEKKIFREYFSIKHFFFGTRIREYGHYGHNNLLHNLLFSVSLCKYVLDIKTLSIPLSKVIFDYINACHIWRFHLLWISITINNIHYPGVGDTLGRGLHLGYQNITFGPKYIYGRYLKVVISFLARTGINISHKN